ncbi:unnamed protein product [Chironomus riparius]|uniref:Kazal-like domain-containing protein n=1 Tax=Chironomus riparius TaxID=315576 RepID=A0A9N9S6S3_9DIPT|nr:unnamed protein product [Chironomus riparius]
MQNFTIILFAVILLVAVNCQRIKRQVTFPDDESESEKKVSERGYWGHHSRRTRRPRPARPTKTSPITTSSAPDTNEVPQHIQECIEECPRRTTSEYNPVCGTNDQTYNNSNQLICAADCGLNVQFRRVGACQPLR